MAKKKRIKSFVSIHPVMTFLILCLGIIIISGVCTLFNVSATYNAVSNTGLDYVSTTESVQNLFSLSGLKYIFSRTVSNFANFTILSHLIIVLLGIGLMEYSGFLKTAIGLLTRKAKKKNITFTIIIMCLLASIVDDIAFIVCIPLAALIFKYGKRNPNIGVIASFAALTCGYGLSPLFTSVDSSIRDLTLKSAHILDPTYDFKIFSLFFIMIAAVLVISFVLTMITEGVAQNLPAYEVSEEDIIDMKKISKPQLRGLLLAGIGSVIYIIIFVYNIIPGLPLSGKFLNYNETLYIDMLFGANSFFANGFVFIITMLFVIWGLLYGIGAKTIRHNRDFIEGLGHSLNGIGKILVYIFAGATFISIIKQSNIGTVIAVSLTNMISNSGFSGLSLIILFFISNIIATIFLPNSITRWSIMSSQVIPTFLNAGLSAEFAHVIFRFSESAFLGITPIFACFIIYLSYLEENSQDEKGIGLGEAIKYQLPYSFATAGILLSIIIIWYLVSLPLGIHGVIGI